MRKDVKRKLYSLGARLTVFFHFIMFLFYFAAIPLLFAKNIWSLIAATYLVFEWLQYLVLDGCVLNFLENHLLKKAGADDYQNAIPRLLHNIVRGQGTRIAPKPKIDKLSWYFKTVWFATAVVVLVLSSPIRMFI
jgi:hypothetical protein